ncbi:MAG TPA: hypothetical protein VGV69_00695 [Solirubrobacterales bacterium]|nr:hypothetical protein [Solirubrobacterales bacterium]
MRLIPRHRQHRDRKPRIAISEAEISADLHYPAQPRQSRRDGEARRLEVR